MSPTLVIWAAKCAEFVPSAPGGVALGPDGKPLLGPDGQPLVIGGEDEIVASSAAEAGSAMADFNFEIDPDELARLVSSTFEVIIKGLVEENWCELKSMMACPSLVQLWMDRLDIFTICIPLK